MTPDEAAFDMDMLDYDFHLFTDADTGLDSVLSRAALGTFELAQLRPSRGMRPLSALPLTYNPQPAPRLTVSEATERLQLSGRPFVFFENSSTGRGNVLYHRYDGNYGLITPAV
jgi:hypothetical protein